MQNEMCCFKRISDKLINLHTGNLSCLFRSFFLSFFLLWLCPIQLLNKVWCGFWKKPGEPLIFDRFSVTSLRMVARTKWAKLKRYFDKKKSPSIFWSKTSLTQRSLPGANDIASLPTFGYSRLATILLIILRREMAAFNFWTKKYPPKYRQKAEEQLTL